MLRGCHEGEFAVKGPVSLLRGALNTPFRIRSRSASKGTCPGKLERSPKKCYEVHVSFMCLWACSQQNLWIMIAECWAFCTYDASNNSSSPVICTLEKGQGTQWSIIMTMQSVFLLVHFSWSYLAKEPASLLHLSLPCPLWTISLDSDLAPETDR